MDDEVVFGNGVYVNSVKDEDEDEFRSCCEDEEVWKDNEEPLKVGADDDVFDETSAKMFFKGISIAGFGDSSSGLTGIGVFIERSAVSSIQVQKKLDFYVEEPIADYFALIDGLMKVVQNNIRHVFAFTDSELLNDQVCPSIKLCNKLVVSIATKIKYPINI